MTIIKRKPRIEPMVDENNRLPRVDMGQLEQDITGNGPPDNVEPGPLAFAPISERLESTGLLMGQGIRQAVDATAKQVTDACADVLKLAQQIVADGDEFAKSLRSVGEAHAERIQKATADMQRLVATMQAERHRFNNDAPQEEPKS